MLPASGVCTGDREQLNCGKMFSMTDKTLQRSQERSVSGRDVCGKTMDTTDHQESFMSN